MHFTTFFLTFIPLFLQISAQGTLTPAYPPVVLTCLASYKACALGDNPSCTQCISDCGNQDVLASPNADVCILLKDYCIAVQGISTPGQCIDPQCVTFASKCKLNGPDSPDCGYCRSNCGACKERFEECGGTEINTIEGCPVKACTYYADLCELSRTDKFCGYCDAVCDGLCQEETQECAKF